MIIAQTITGIASSFACRTSLLIGCVSSAGIQTSLFFVEAQIAHCRTIGHKNTPAGEPGHFCFLLPGKSMDTNLHGWMSELYTIVRTQSMRKRESTSIVH
jgi:hypothetical protein